jgi:Flp pilus assembly protein TadD
MDTAAVWSDIGVVRAQLGDVKGARRAFEESLKRDPKFIETYKNFALLAIQQGQKGKLENCSKRQGIYNQPNHAEILALLDFFG